ncbi:MAG: U32 family peptidase [Candidatus Brocadiia bacterium]|nr:MAG: U32 family peptidase [Candidatus Brocadiia bacterium]
MSDNKQKIELLAPAKDLQAGIAAVQCGADAVYIGAPRFSAREAAGNSLDDILKLVNFAHPYYVKVYAALNTILDDREMRDAEKMIGSLHETGIDGLIIQDAGLLELSLPPLPLIASTQMHNSTADKVKFLEDVGFSRVILARELTLEQIREIRRRTSIELECFVNGALCVGQSGQCYMSYAIGGRSGNRGQCAQPCRKLYSLSDTAGKTICPNRYLLSLKDLNLSEYVTDLLDAGISSFKIEGRLKDAAYVANITAFYQQLLDTILPEKKLRKSSSGSIQLNFTPDPSKTFNRGFTDYGITGRRDKMGSIDTPKSIGEEIGKVRKVSADHFEVAGDIELHNGDGICFFDDNNDLQGTTINRVQGEKVFPQKIIGIKTGTIIYRNLDHKFNQLIQKIPAHRKIPLSMRLYETADGIALEAKDQDGNCAAVQIPHNKEPVRNAENARENITVQLTKLGNTVFCCDDLKIELAELYFFPVSALNQLRRDLVDAMLAKRLSNRPVRKGGVLKNNTPYPQRSIDYTGNVFNENARRFYQRHGVTQISPAAETGLDLKEKLVMRTKYCVRHQLNLCQGHAVAAEPLILTNRENDRFLLKFRCSDCGMDIYLTKP